MNKYQKGDVVRFRNKIAAFEGGPVKILGGDPVNFHVINAEGMEFSVGKSSNLDYFFEGRVDRLTALVLFGKGTEV